MTTEPGARGRHGPQGPASTRHRPARRHLLTGLTGTLALARLALRRDRILLPAWVFALTVAVTSTALGFKTLYRTPAERALVAASTARNGAFAFIYGRLYGTSVGALTAWRYATYAALGAALMSIFLVIRHTRADEEAGRLELAGSARVGRQAPLTAALLVAVGACLALAVVMGTALSAVGLEPSGAFAFSAGTAACGLAFAGVAVTAAQIAGTARGARGLAVAALAAAFLLRAVGDSAGPGGPSWLTWASPIGWTEKVQAFAGDRWWLVVPGMAVAVVTVGLGYALAQRRDLGAGLVMPRPGPPQAGPALAGVLGLSWRLQRGPIAGWTVGFLVAIPVGALAKSIGSLIGTSPQMRRIFTQIGGRAALSDAFLAAIMSLAGLVVAAYAVSAVLRIRSEEADGRADPILASPVGRVRWGLSHIAVTVAGLLLMLVVAGLGAGAGYASQVGGPGTQLGRMAGAALAQAPAVLVVAALAVAAVGLAPAAAAAIAWSSYGLTVVLVLFGRAMNLPQAVLDISPFTHVPRLPGAAFSATPMAWLVVIAVAIGCAGLAGLRRRDIG